MIPPAMARKPSNASSKVRASASFAQFNPHPCPLARESRIRCPHRGCQHARDWSGAALSIGIVHDESPDAEASGLSLAITSRVQPVRLARDAPSVYQMSFLFTLPEPPHAGQRCSS